MDRHVNDADAVCVGNSKHDEAFVLWILHTNKNLSMERHLWKFFELQSRIWLSSQYMTHDAFRMLVDGFIVVVLVVWKWDTYFFSSSVKAKKKKVFILFDKHHYATHFLRICPAVPPVRKYVRVV